MGEAAGRFGAKKGKSTHTHTRLNEEETTHTRRRANPRGDANAHPNTCANPATYKMAHFLDFGPSLGRSRTAMMASSKTSLTFFCLMAEHSM